MASEGSVRPLDEYWEMLYRGAWVILTTRRREIC